MNKNVWLVIDPDSDSTQCVATTLAHARLYIEKLAGKELDWEIQQWALTKDRTRYHYKRSIDVPGVDKAEAEAVS